MSENHTFRANEALEKIFDCQVKIIAVVVEIGGYQEMK